MSWFGPPDALRLALFGGLLVHKALWEIMKRRGFATPSRSNSTSMLRRLVKTAKFLVLLGLVAQTLFLNLLPITDQSLGLNLVGSVVFLVGLVTAMLGRIQLGKNWKDVEDLQVAQQQGLTTNGIYGYVRHPIYAGDMLLLIGLELALNSWLVLAMVVPILAMARQATAEEAVLKSKFRDYSSYSARTKRFIPFLV